MFRDLKAYIWACFALAFNGDGKTQFALNMVVPSILGVMSNWIDVGWLLQNVVARSLQVAVGVFAMHMFLVSPFRLYRSHLAEIAKLRSPIVLTYEPVEPFLKQNRAEYNNDQVAMRVTVKRRMTGLRCVVKSIQPKTGGGWGEPLNHISSFGLGMPHGEASWQPRDVADEEWIILFHHAAGKLSVFTDACYREFIDWKTDLPIGEYLLKVSISATNLDEPVRKEIVVNWPGDITKLMITIKDSA